MPRGHRDFTKPIAFTAQTVEVKLLPDWGTVEGWHVDLVAFKLASSGVWTTILSYKVPEGRTLLLYDWSVALPDQDGQVCGAMWIKELYLWLGLGGGFKGFQVSLTRPKRVDSEQTLEVRGIQVSGVDQTLGAHIGGVLI